VNFDFAARQRLLLYRAYLYLIMWVEAIPRRYTGYSSRWKRSLATGNLERRICPHVELPGYARHVAGVAPQVPLRHRLLSWIGQDRARFAHPRC